MPNLGSTSQTRELASIVRRTTLASGLRVVTESIPAARSVSLGIWVGVGSRDETPELSGVSHFLEHLLFKGTGRRSALDIATEVEAVGGETNAFTTKEYTCYYARVLDAETPLAIDVLGDLVTGSLLRPADVETERGVILEEIAMHEDEPGDEVHDLFLEAVYGDHPLGRQISGTEATVGALSRTQLVDFYAERYAAPAIVVAAAGNLCHDAVVEQVEAAFARSGRFSGTSRPALPRPHGPIVPTRGGQTVVRSKDTEQAHVVLGMAGLARDDDRRFALSIANNVLGGGMSSRLFQEIRERRGLAYSVYSFSSSYADSGVFGVYAGCSPSKIDEVLQITRDQLAVVAADGFDDVEVERGRNMLKGAVVLGLEETGSRMSRLGKGELVHDERLTVDELLGRIDAVTAEQVRQIATEVLASPSSLAVVGPFETDRFG